MKYTGRILPFLLIFILSVQTSIPFSGTIANSGIYKNATSDKDTTSWSMFMHDPSHTGFSPSHAPHNSHLAWASYIGSPILASPIIDDNMLYIGTNNGTMFCLKQDTGELVWSYDTGNNISSEAAVAYGIVYFGTVDGTIRALDSTTGKQVWNRSIKSNISSPIVTNGMIFICAMNGMVYAFNATDGATLWTYQSNSAIYAPPAYSNGTVFFGTGNGNVYSLNTNGTKVWSYGTKSSILVSPTVSSNMVYFSAGKTVYALDSKSSKLIWSNQTGGEPSSPPASAYGKIFIGCNDDNLYVFNQSTGQLEWKHEISNGIHSALAIADGELFVSSLDGGIYALSANDSKSLWSYIPGNAILSSPAIASDKLFVGSQGMYVYAFGSGLPALIGEFKTIPAYMRGGETDTILIKVIDSTNLPITNANISLYSKLNGIFTPSYFGVTNNTGEFSVKFTAPDLQQVDLISANISKTEYTGCFNYVEISISRQPRLTAKVVVSPSLIMSGGTVKISITVLADNVNCSGAYVNLSTSYGKCADPFGISDASGNFTTIYTAPVTKRKLIDVLITRIQKPQYTQSVNYAIIEIRPNLLISLAANPNTIYAGTSAVFSVYVGSDASTPVSDVELLITSSTGVVYPEKGYSDSMGRFTGTFYAPSDATNCIIWVNATKQDYMNGNATLQINSIEKGSPMLGLKLDADTNEMPRSGVDHIRTLVTDSDTGKPEPNANIEFMSTSYAGQFSQVYYDTTGFAHTNFTANIVKQNITFVIEASATMDGYVGTSAGIMITIVAMKIPLNVWVLANPENISSSGSANITIYVQDYYNDAVSGAGITVTVQTLGPIIMPEIPAETSQKGVYSTIFYPGNVSVYTRYNITVSANKSGYASASATVSIDVNPELVNNTVCGIVSPVPNSIVSGSITVRLIASASEGSVVSVQIQISSDNRIYGTEWVTATGKDDWQISIDTTKLDNGYYRIYARSYDGTNYSETVSSDIWVENPEPSQLNYYSNIIVIGIAGEAVLIIIAALYLKYKKKNPDDF